MKLFKCHAVMPLLGNERMRVVKTYVVAAATWEAARARVRDEEPGAEFVTTPVETPTVLPTEVALMSELEFADLRSACSWREKQMPAAEEPMPIVHLSKVNSKR